MDDFQIISLTVEERKLLDNQEYERRNDILYEIGYQTAGFYELAFPNGKKVVGWSKHLGKQLKEILRSVAPVKGSTRKTYVAKWCAAAKEENKGLIKSVKDIRIKVWRTLDYEKKGKEYLRMIPSNDRPHYYNEKFFD